MKKIITLISILFSFGLLKAQECINYSTTNSGLVNNVTWGIYIDSQDNIWTASSGGVSKFSNGTWQTYNSTNSGFPSNFCRDVTRTNNDDIWIGLVTSGVYWYNGSTWTFFNSSNSNLTNNSVYDIFTDSNDDVWVATSLGVCKFNGSDWTPYNTSNVISFPSPLVYDLDENLNQQLLIGAGPQGNWQGGLGVLVSNTNSTTYRTPLYPLASNNVNCSLTDSSGNIWIGTDNGISKFNVNLNTWETYNTSNSTLPSLTVTDIEIFYGDTSRVWVSTNGGLTSFNLLSNVWESGITTANSCLTTNNINDLEIDRHGNVWMSGVVGGLTVYNRSTIDGSIVTDLQPNAVEEVITVYPNPSERGVYYLSKKTDFKVSSISGTLLLQSNNSSIVDLSEFPRGIYYLINGDTVMKLKK